MAHDIFISYSSRDKTVADAVCAGLEAHRIKCWMAPRDIRPGQIWGESIIDAINSSKVMIIVFSDHSNKSIQVMREVERAVHKSVVVIPFRIQDIEPTKSMEYYLSSTHWLDALTPDLELHIKQLIDTVGSILKIEIITPESGSGREEHEKPIQQIETPPQAPIKEEPAPPVVETPVMAKPVRQTSPPDQPSARQADKPRAEEIVIEATTSQRKNQSKRSSIGIVLAGIFLAIGSIAIVLALIIGSQNNKGSRKKGFDSKSSSANEKPLITGGTYTIGAIFSITGPAAFLGDPQKKTIDMLADQINDAGGILGHSIEVVI